MYFEMLLKNIDNKLLPKQVDGDWMKSNKQMESCKDMEEDKPLEVSMFEPEKKKKKKKILMDTDIFVSSNKNLNSPLKNKKSDISKNEQNATAKPTSKTALGRHNGKTVKITKSKKNNFNKLQERNNEITSNFGSRKQKLDKHLAKLSNGYKKIK